jgi:hypothetical protein
MAYTDAELRRPSGFSLLVLLFIIAWLIGVLVFAWVVAGVTP